MKPDAAAQLLKIVWALRDAIVSSNRVTPTEHGMARMVLLRDEKIPEILELLGQGIVQLTLDTQPAREATDYSRSDLLDLLQDALAHITPTLSTHEEIVALLHRERNFVCMCGYCPPTGRDRKNGPCICGATESHNCPGRA